jgi:OFA family oxalate/formate antiporter-like MFS transporter
MTDENRTGKENLWMKYLILTLVVLSQACFGSLYAWSAFVPPLQESYALSATGGQIIFGGMILTNTIIMILAGKLLSRWGPRPLVIAGGFLFAAGYLLAGFSGGSFTLLFLGVAVFVGCGIGLGYITLLITCMQWFPDNKGLASGLAVAGFGGGGDGSCHYCWQNAGSGIYRTSSFQLAGHKRWLPNNYIRYYY